MRRIRFPAYSYANFFIDFIELMNVFSIFLDEKLFFNDNFFLHYINQSLYIHSQN